MNNMDREEETEHLAKRRNELRRLHCDLDDIVSWFRTNDNNLSHHISFSQLGDAMEIVDEVANEIEAAGDKLTENENE